MRKIPTLFLRDENDRRYVTRQVNPDTAWVLDGEGVATRKFDGTCTMLDESGRWWARREVKPGKAAPAGFVAEQTDEVTGKTMGWEPIEQSPFVKAFRSTDPVPTEPGTYELCGPKVNGNPEQFPEHELIRHGVAALTGVPTNYDDLARYLGDGFPYEGIVWRHPDGRMAKIKRRDFPRPSGSPQAPTSSAG